MGSIEGTEVADVITSGDVELACTITGDGGTLAVCLHGFPDSVTTWRHVTPALVEAGYQVVAPAMRGYAPSSISPSGTYQTGALAMDAIAIHEHFGGGDSAVLIGHDWGAPAAYGAAGHAPQRWRKVVGMSVPPGRAMANALLTDRRQVKRSWYMFFFQHRIADAIVAADDGAFIDMLWDDWSPGYVAAEDLAAVKAALPDADHVAAALGYYRCSLGAEPNDPDLADVQTECYAPTKHPTLYLHGADDGCVGVDVAEGLDASAGADVTVEIVEGAGHFLHLERPDHVHHKILEFLR